ESGHERRRLAEVAPQPDDLDVVGAGVESRQRGERAVGRAVVDEDRLPLAPERLESRAKLVVEERDAPLLVVHRHDDGDHGTGLCRLSKRSRSKAAAEVSWRPSSKPAAEEAAEEAARRSSCGGS